MALVGGAFSIALAVLLVLLAATAGVVEAKTRYVLNLDHHTFWKVVRQGRLAIVKFDKEHPYGLRQENWVELAREVALSPGAGDVFFGEIRIKDSDSEPGGRSPNIPTWDYFNCSLIQPPHIIALVPNGRIDWARNHSDAINTADDDEFDLTFNMSNARQFHQAIRIDVNVSQQFTAGLGARWINALLRRYPELDSLEPKLKYPTADAKPLTRRVLGNQTKPGTGYVSFSGLGHPRCQALAAGPAQWRVVLKELEAESKAREAYLAERARIEAEQDAILAAEADGDDEKAAVARVREVKELQRVENTNDGRKQREEAQRQARLHRERTWLTDLLRKMLGVKRCPAKVLPESRHGSNEDRAAQLEEATPCGEGTADEAAKTPAFNSLARVREEERKLRFVARSQWLSHYARLRADMQLSALWCAKRHFAFGDDA